MGVVECRWALRNGRAGSLAGKGDVARAVVGSELAEIPGGGRRHGRTASPSTVYAHGTTTGFEGVYAGAGRTYGKASGSRPTRSSAENNANPRGRDAAKLTSTRQENRKIGLCPRPLLDEYYMTGQTSDLYTFGASGYAAAGGNPVAQIVGSFRWTITPTDGGINLSLTNTTSFRSLTLDVGPQWQRFPIVTPCVTFTSPMGNTHQAYNITAKCQ